MANHSETRCKNCQFWLEFNYGRDGITHECSFPDWGTYNSKPEADSFTLYADALDDSGLQCGIITGPEFGCLKFKAHE